VKQLHSYTRHRHLRPIFSSSKQKVLSVTSILRHCQSRNTWPRLMNFNFQSRFSTQANIPFSQKWCQQYLSMLNVDVSRSLSLLDTVVFKHFSALLFEQFCSVSRVCVCVCVCVWRLVCIVTDKWTNHYAGRTYRRASSPTAPTMSTIRPISRATHNTTAIAVPNTSSTSPHQHPRLRSDTANDHKPVTN